MRDERLVIGFFALHLLVAAPGLAVLYALGLVRPRAAAFVAAAGPAFLLGVVVAAVPLILLLTAGVSVTTPLSLAVLAGATVVVALVGVRRRGRGGPALIGVDESDRPPVIETVIERVVLVAIAAYMAVGALAYAHLPTSWDDANIWSLRGLSLYHFERLVPELFRNPDLAFVHLDYPILQPLFEASFFRAIGSVDLRLWHVELWIFLGAVIWTLAWLLAPLGKRWLWTIVVGVLAVSSLPAQVTTLGDVDATMAGLLGCGALAFGIWLERGQRSHAILGALLVGGAANVKNEGLAFGAAVVGALILVVVVGRLRTRWKDLAVSLGILAACVLPWQIWVAGNEYAANNTPSPWELIDNPGYLSDRIDFLWRGIEQVVLQHVDTTSWGLLVPAFLVLAMALILIGRHRAVASFYLGAWLLTSLAVAYTYWVTPIGDLAGFEQRTGPRIVIGVIFVTAAGLAHLVQLGTVAATSDVVAGDDELVARPRPSDGDVAAHVGSGASRRQRSEP